MIIDSHREAIADNSSANPNISHKDYTGYNHLNPTLVSYRSYDIHLDTVC